MRRHFTKRPGCLVPMYAEDEVIERFEAKISHEPMSGCWFWMGASKEASYGSFRIGEKVYSAHRAAYELYIGVIAKNLHVLHKCDNPCCVNPSHLWLGTHAQNMRDSATKGRARAPKGEMCPNSKLTESDVRAICQKRRDGKKIRIIAREFNVSKTCIQNICCGRTWSDITGIKK